MEEVKKSNKFEDRRLYLLAEHSSLIEDVLPHIFTTISEMKRELLTRYLFLNLNLLDIPLKSLKIILNKFCCLNPLPKQPGVFDKFKECFSLFFFTEELIEDDALKLQLIKVLTNFSEEELECFLVKKNINKICESLISFRFDVECKGEYLDALISFIAFLAHKKNEKKNRGCQKKIFIQKSRVSKN